MMKELQVQKISLITDWVSWWVVMEFQNILSFMFVKFWDNFSLFLKSRDPCMSSYYIEFWVNSLVLMNGI
jgi:hypothetical protein